MKLIFPYYRRNPLAIAQLLLCDLFYWLYARVLRQHIFFPKTLNRILLVNPAHLGDVVISTAILRELKAQLPNCQVDFLVGQWSAPLIQDHPGIDHAFYISHWHANRSQDSISEKKARYQDQAERVMAELEQNTYDAIFFLNSYEPSFISLFKKFSCPLIGFETAGGGPLLSYKGKQSEVHEIQIQASLFEPWLGSTKNLSQYKPWLKDIEHSPFSKTALGLTKPYVVIHPGSGNPAKEWPIENWLEVSRALSQFDIDIVITGDGEREKNQSALLAGERTINLVGKLSFDQFVGVIAGSVAVLCVDSVASHIASACDKEAVIIGNGLSIIERWHPLGNNITLLEKKMPCSPCHSHPCAQRPCVTGIGAQMLINRLPEILGKR